MSLPVVYRSLKGSEHPADAVNKAFNIRLKDCEFDRGQDRSHNGVANLPSSVAKYLGAAALSAAPVTA